MQLRMVVRSWAALVALVIFSWSLSPEAVLAGGSSGQLGALRPGRTKNTAILLRAFVSIVQQTKDSVVRLDVDEKEAALAAIIGTNGLAVTKASEISHGKLTAKLASGQRVEARILAIDDENDLGLIVVNAPDLKPIQWASRPSATGQWAITPGIEATPEAVGIISVPARKIPPKQALLGVRLDFSAATARIAEITPGYGAEKAGLKPGDIVLSVNGTVMNNSDDLVRTLRNFRESQTIQLHIQRNGAELEAAAEMMAFKPNRRWREYNRQERMNHLGGELSRRAEGFQSAIQHDTVLQPWQCGGPVVNLDGMALGLNIARAGRVASYALPASLVQRLIEELKKESEMPVAHEEGQAATH